MSKTKTRPHCTPSDPTTWPRDITRPPVDICRPVAEPATWAADLTQPTTTPSAATGDERQSSMSGMTSAVSSAASVSAQGATAAGATAPRLAPNGPTGNANATENAPQSDPAAATFPESGDDGPAVGVDSTSTKPNATLTHCEQCGAEFLSKTGRGRFCGPYCRRRAWLARNPEKAAELAERDKARLRARVIALGGVWVEREPMNGGEACYTD